MKTMDALFSKYARPFDLLDGMIITGRLADFINEFWNLENDRKAWEFYLHKVYDKSYEDFRKSMPNQTKAEPVSTEQIGATIKNSKNILDGFTPNE